MTWLSDQEHHELDCRASSDCVVQYPGQIAIDSNRVQRISTQAAIGESAEGREELNSGTRRGDALLKIFTIQQGLLHPYGLPNLKEVEP